MQQQIFFMSEAIQEAKLAMQEGNIPVGAVIVNQNKVIARSHNDQFWHAEILCIQKAQQILGKHLVGASIFVNLKPCPMCLHACRLARLENIFYGCDNDTDCLPNINIISGIKESESAQLLQDYFKNKRK